MKDDDNNTLPTLPPLSDCSASSHESPGHSRPPLHVVAAANSVPHFVKGLPHACDDSVGSSSVSSCCGKKKHVSFGDLEVRLFPVCLGDNPECQSGPPVSIGWKSFQQMTISLDAYESTRSPRKSKDELQLTWIDRKRMLRSAAGVSDQEMRSAIYDAEIIKKSRRKTVQRQRFEVVEVFAETLAKKGRRILGRNKHN